MDQRKQAALLGLLKYLEEANYDFVVPTPATCRANLARRQEARSPRDALGWSRIFQQNQFDPEMMEILAAADCLEQVEGGLKCRVRVSRVHGRLYLHSSYPTDNPDAVFLGPDSYRFADLICREMSGRAAPRTILDVGAGAGVGGGTARLHAPDARIYLSDVNQAALELAQINAAHGGFEPVIVHASGLDGAPDNIDLIVMNPPYIAGTAGHIYKDGGDLHGARLSLEWAVAAAERLAVGGRVILYTGSAILEGGDDQLRALLSQRLAPLNCDLEYSELDPDIFGGELRRDAYDDVERIAAVGAMITKR